MRVGDFDELKKRLHEYCIDNDPECQKYYDFLGIDECIDNTPTVEAIPLEVHEKAMDVAVTDLFKVQEELNRIRNEKRQGEWIAREDMDYLDENKVVHNHFQCNKCGLVHDFIDGHTSQYNFCPQCGADMRKPNCVTCNHFGICEGCEKEEEE